MGQKGSEIKLKRIAIGFLFAPIGLTIFVPASYFLSESSLSVRLKGLIGGIMAVSLLFAANYFVKKAK